MAYTNPSKVRDLLGVDINDAPDALLNKYITYGDEIVLRSITETIITEDLDQAGDSYNIYQTENPFIADRNFDQVVNTLDVTVYYVDNDLNTLPLTVSSVDGTNGKIEISTIHTEAFLSTIDVKIDYQRYICKPDWTLIELASSYYAAFMWVGRELYLVPERYFLGELRIYGREPWKHFKKQFDRLIQIIVNQPISKVEYEKMVIAPRSLPSTEEVTDEMGLKKRGFI